jgi:ketosteroid isomerase-like protein
MAIRRLKVCSVLPLSLPIFLLLWGTGMAQKKPAPKASNKRTVVQTGDFAAQMQKLRESWVQEFNGGHADRVADFYAPEAVLMRWDGSVHGKDSILAEMQRSITGGAHNYSVSSLHTERSGDLGYDTGAYNVTLRDRVIEGNYVVVVKRIAGQWKIVAHASVPNPALR